MATPFDALAKDLLDLLLRDHGTVEREVEIAALPSQRSDVLFVPRKSLLVRPPQSDVVTRMQAAPCLIEPFHDTPGVADVEGCLRKLLNHRHARALGRLPAAERSWMLCGGRPDAAIAGLRATPAAERGVYEPGPMLPLSLVVLPELDPDDDLTLPLRLMAKGATWRRAVATLEARWQALPLGRALHAAVVQMLTSARVRRAPLTEDEMIDIEAAERFLREERQEERAAVIGAVFPALVQLAELRTGRAMGDDQRAALRRRIDVDGVQAASEALVSLDAVALAAWLREGSA